MAGQADDKNANWREKYLDALDQQEQQEKAAAGQQELLRRALVRVSVSADGQDDALDTILGQLRERLRASNMGDMSNLFARLDDVALSFEAHREKNAEDVEKTLTAVVKPLQTLELSRAVKKEISQYLAQLPLRSKKVRLYPALLQQLASIQQQALKEIEPPKRSFWQKLAGHTPVEKTIEKKSQESTATVSKIIADNDSMHAAESVTRNKDYAVIDAEFVVVDKLEKNANIMPSMHHLKQELPPEFVEKITHILNEFLMGLETEAAISKKAQLIRARINDKISADVFVSELDNLRHLVMQAYLLSNHAFASYLENVNQELVDIYTVVGGAVESDATLKNATKKMQDTMQQGMSELEAYSDSAIDLAQLKGQVKSQIGNIRQAFDHYLHTEQQQLQLAEQLETLCNKIKTLEVDAEKNRSILEVQRHKTLHDPLTELPNREYYYERSAYEFQRWQRYGRALTIAVFDIDHFKKINDGHGHQAGDRVLKVIGSSILKRLRDVDFFCRYGGEEFVVLMPETSLEEAAPVLDKIRAAIANAAFNYKDKPIAITLSVGATEFKTGDDLEAAFVRADGALYAAKSGGRNCLRLA